MIELLKLCGIEGQELEAQLPRIEKAFSKLGISDMDIEKGKERLNKYYDIELLGVRKALRLCVLEMVSTVLARKERKKVIFGFMSGGFDLIGAAMMSKSKDVYTGRIEFTFLLMLGCIFDKLAPVLEAAEKQWLKAGGVAHCGNVKTITGLLAMDFLPRPDLLVTTGFLCETAPKTLYMLHDLYDIPVGYFDTCQDTKYGEGIEAENRILSFAEKSLRKFVLKAEEVVGFTITGDMLGETLDARKRFAEATHKLDLIMEKSDPLPMGPATVNILSCMGSLPLSVDRVPEAIDAINTVCGELQDRVDKGIGVVEKGAPRIIAPLPMHHGDPRMEHLITELGIAFLPSGIGGPPVGPTMDEETDPFLELSQGVGGAMGSGLVGRIAMIIDECKRMKVDGLLDRFHAGCRTMVGDAIIMKEAVEREVGIPVFLLEWENFDTRVYNHDEYKRRLEVFKAMMTGKNA